MASKQGRIWSTFSPENRHWLQVTEARQRIKLITAELESAERLNSLRLGNRNFEEIKSRLATARQALAVLLASSAPKP